MRLFVESRNFSTLAGCALTLVLCSCAATSVLKTYKAPGAQRPPGKIAALTIDERSLLRKGFENRLVSQLSKAGAPAVTTFDLLSLPEIKQDKTAAAERFQKAGADSVLILRLAMSSTSYREVQPGHERYASTITGVENMGWYDYYSVGYMDMSPTYGYMKQKVYLEAALYDLKTEKRLWSALVETVLKENMDRVEEMDPLVGKIVSAMRKDGMLP